VRLLLDTHALLWILAAPEKLPATVRRAVQAAENEVYASVASAWEIAIRVALGRLDFDLQALERALAASGIQAFGISLQHATRVAQLPAHHRDPFDRMLVAQALSESMTLVSRDRELARYGVRLLWREGERARRRTA
jgi:PIN domain nuclease of toxin-antitoxin system